MKEKSDYEILYYFYLHSDLIEEAWTEYKSNPSPLRALNLNSWILTSFNIYDDISRMLPAVLSRSKPQNPSSEENESAYELKRIKLSIQMNPLLLSIRNRSFYSKQGNKKAGGQNGRYFWELQKELTANGKGTSINLLEESAKEVIRFNNELELDLIEYYGFNYRKKLNIDAILK
ncbi:hypothetical protein LEP1GSC050_0447 [Leptospira broomii serovar Hurstbridge str. 5399]|uniref:Uncharacterized protein n=1 Tax=Leptospira broomii serovar Hurstbridge str. 5399 TaxID=1049789 RepID=T0F684_9LEPT|nr:hypothetical protein [Leptospira broomii]EQA46595.1 hypothetical protein LEP1GSC050_0447 [Leptospira broomii serovar Hurstbridge str. 5399]